MRSDGFSQSLTASDMIIQLTLERGCDLFEQKRRNLLTAANHQSHQIVRSMVRQSEFKPKTATHVNSDFQPKPIKKDNMGSYEARFEFRSRSTNRTAGGSRYRKSRQGRSAEANSSVCSKTGSRARSRSRRGNKSELVNMNPEKQPTAQEVEQSIKEDKYRRLRDIIKNQAKEHEVYLETKKETDAKAARSFQQKKEELQRKRLVYTFDFDGKVMMCDAINRKRRLIGEELCVETKGEVEKMQQHQPIEIDDFQQLKKQAIKGDIFRSMLDMGRAQANDFTFQQHDFGSQYGLNEVYNNHNMRQVSSIPHVELVDGVKLKEQQNSAELCSRRKGALNRLSFLESIKNRRFRLHKMGGDTQEVLQAPQEVQSKTPMAVTSDVANITLEEIPPVSQAEREQRASKFTGSTAMNKTANKHVHYGESASSNLFGTSHNYHPHNQPRIIVSRRKPLDKIQIHSSLMAALLG